MKPPRRFIATLTPPREVICSPILAPYVWPCPWPLDIHALNDAASHVLGTHDFTSFAASDPDLTARSRPEPSSNLRTHHPIPLARIQ